MLIRKFVTCAGLGAMALLGTAVTANASEAGQLGTCREPVGPAHVFGRSVHLWLCDDGWHGQITNAATGDELWLDSAAGTVTNWTTVPSGATSANTRPVGQFGGPWRACGKAVNTSSIACTGRN